MNEYLKVNSKTDILEFKRKHNLLVENGTIKANVSNIKTLSNDAINNLRCGDVVLKEDASGKHAYLVSFKSDTGLCLTYCDASCVETQSYDKVEGNWVYNSEDKWEMTKPIYCHPIELQYQSSGRRGWLSCLIFNNDPTPFNYQSWFSYITNLINNYNAVIMCSGGIGIPDQSLLFVATNIKKSTGDTIAIHGVDSITFSFTYYSISDTIVPTVFTDGVNKIN